MKLSIAIPTYNRPEELKASVSALAPQLSEDVQIIILDNSSRMPVADLLSELVDQYSGRIIITRNAHNIGGCPNIVRLFEVCNSDWIWTLGDDDRPVVDAVKTIIDGIAKVDSSVAYMCFGFKGFKEDHTVLGYEELLEKMNRENVLANLIGMSSGVYRRSLIIPHMHIAYYLSNSHIPHTALLLKSLSQGATAYFNHTSIMIYQHAEAGNSWLYENVMMGTTTLLEIDGLDTKAMAKMVSNAIVTYRYRPFITGSFRRVFYGGGKNTQYWVIFFWRMTLHMRGVRKIQAFFFLVCAVVLSTFRSDKIRGEKTPGCE
jgi:glycosyltransferase involved in cell wall biosynthesis